MKDYRLDKWLWAVRIFKTRSIAAEYCKKGKVKINEISSKPSKSVNINDIIDVYKNHINYKYKVTGLIDKRVSFEIAKKNYIDLTPKSEFINSEVYKTENRKKGLGRPTKKDLRNINKFLNN